MFQERIFSFVSVVSLTLLLVGNAKLFSVKNRPERNTRRSMENRMGECLGKYLI
jgi:hypothetical protein